MIKSFNSNCYRYPRKNLPLGRYFIKSDEGGEEETSSTPPQKPVQSGASPQQGASQRPVPLSPQKKPTIPTSPEGEGLQGKPSPKPKEKLSQREKEKYESPAESSSYTSLSEEGMYQYKSEVLPGMQKEVGNILDHFGVQVKEGETYKQAIARQGTEILSSRENVSELLSQIGSNLKFWAGYSIGGFVGTMVSAVAATFNILKGQIIDIYTTTRDNQIVEAHSYARYNPDWSSFGLSLFAGLLSSAVLSFGIAKYIQNKKKQGAAVERDEILHHLSDKLKREFVRTERAAKQMKK